MNLFIDTNIYLTFYHFSNDDLEELKKLIVAIKDKQIVVHLPEQIVREFKRNREAKIADAFKKLNEQKMPDQFPQFCKDYPEYTQLIDSLKEYKIAKDKLLEKLITDIKNKCLGADQIIAEIFELAENIPTTNELLAHAKNRFDIGDPPGKNSSYGDAINWLSLLKTIPEKSDIHIIARDKDYYSLIDNEVLSEFLSGEWKEIKNSQAFLYSSLSDFFNKHFPNIKLASEMQKRLTISKLTESWSFERTHKAISKLSLFTDFTDKEIEELLDVALNNNQIKLIIKDNDVQQFYLNLVKGHEQAIDKAKLEELYILLQNNEDDV